MLPTEFNIVIDNGCLIGDEKDVFFDGQSVTTFNVDDDMADILCWLGVFSSKSQVRKDPRWKNNLEIPKGWTDFEKVGKMRLRVTILNPTEDNVNHYDIEF